MLSKLFRVTVCKAPLGVNIGRRCDSKQLVPKGTYRGRGTTPTFISGLPTYRGIDIVES